jgi:ribonuclease BN (tRNA processing enzyme)
MLEAGIDFKSVDMILLTHFHPDHSSDLVPFLFASNYSYGPSRQDPFLLIGPEGLEQFFNGLVGVYGEWIVPTGNRLVRREMKAGDADSFMFRDISIRSVPSPHANPSVSYRISGENGSVTVTGDTDYSHDLVELAESTDLLVCECSMPDHMKIPGHLTPTEAGQIAERSRSRVLLLTHFYPPCEDADTVRSASSIFRGTVLKAHDLMTLIVRNV